MFDALELQQRGSTGGNRLVGSDSLIKRVSCVASVKGWFSFQEERKMELESCRRHFDTWRKLWGRPGHGAPIDHAHRNNLYNILYRPAIYWISTCREKSGLHPSLSFHAMGGTSAKSLYVMERIAAGQAQLAIKDNRFASLRYNMTIEVDGDTSFFLRVVDLERTEFS